MSLLAAASLVVVLLSSNAIVQSSTTPFLNPRNDLRPHIKGQLGPVKVNSLALALQQEKYQFGAIGCNFSDSVCDLNLEYCFNDHAFGKCVSLLGTTSTKEEESFKFNLKRDDVHFLELAMEELFQKGFRWNHSYTQCTLQNLLQSIKERVPPGKFDCIEDPMVERVKGQLNKSPESLAFLPTEHELPEYTPPQNRKLQLSSSNYHIERERIPNEQIRNHFKQAPLLDATIGAEELEKALELDDDYLDLGSPTDSEEDNQEQHLARNSEWAETPVREDPLFIQLGNSEDLNPAGGDEDTLNLVEPKIFGKFYNTPEGFRHGIETKDDLAFLNESPQMTYDPEENAGDWNENPTTNKLNQKELAAVALLMGQIEKAAKEEALENQLEAEIEAALDDRKEEGDEDGVFVELPDGDSVYSEDGLVFLKNPKRFLYEGASNSPVDEDAEYELGFRPDLRPSEFERRERLDVKKPGPWYRTVNNYAFDKRQQERLKPEPRLLKMNPEFAGLGPADMKIRDTSTHDKKKLKIEGHNKGSASDTAARSDEVNQLVNLMKKAGSTEEASKLAEKVPGNPLEVVDTSFVNIQLGKTIPSWQVAAELVTLLADFLDVKHSTFQYIRLHDNLVITFKVASNKQQLRATDVAKLIEKWKPSLEKEMDVSIISATAGVKANAIQSGQSGESMEDAADDGGGAMPDFPATEPLILDDGIHNKNLYLGVFAVCGIVAAALVASFLFFVIRKTAKSREKLAKLSQDDPAMESCKDYQDLCRARMASKSNEKVEPIRAVQRVQSNVSEGGTSSSRSSTSSWSEEPVLTNMDISTGHMVLSYMEDHLKKKDRLDQEWAALCTYEADPGCTSIGEKAENQKKNRYTNSLPYDHSRVILNDLANIAGADYINASTITDHDPRNPAYIATQGPLPNTAADFWQMVWEQGSVVIVTLTKLTENGTSLCHRYWPEEGSELYHIYEVHLVSEHIWCDEYLVRSFYLKNLKTGETRTVTQFHFLAWPENGIPTSAKSLLEFRRKVNKSYRGRSCPIIVHCSDGAGRSGTYALIDMVLNRMTKGAKEIDIAASLEHIRDQRPGMVRTKQQFEFVLMAVAEEVHAILKALPQ